MITGNTVLAGVIGWPVAHSRSPRLHNHWLARHGIDGAYVPLPVRPGALPQAVAGLRAAGFAGVNVTIPHKEAALALCDTLDAAAQSAGAVNTLVFAPDGVHGANTDGAGFLANLAAQGVTPGPTLLLGAGGAARAIASALLRQGLPVTIANRTPARTAALQAILPGLQAAAWPPRDLSGFGLLVNATSLGMAGHPPLDFDLGAHLPVWLWPTSSMCRCRRRSWPARRRMGWRRCPGWACCCTRRCRVLPPGSALRPRSIRRSTT